MKTKKEIMSKEFKVNDDFTICRPDYEGLPCPMCAWKWSDEQMTALAKNIAAELEQYSYDECYDLQDQKEDAFWREMEICAVAMGMKYYEDMTDEEFHKTEEEWNNLE